MKTCSKCSRENPDDVVFCIFCGNKFAVLCPNCGRENKLGAVVCGYCGTSLAPRIAPDNPSSAIPDLAQPASSASPEAALPKTIKPAWSIWLVGAFWAFGFIVISVISSLTLDYTPEEWARGLASIPRAFIVLWLLFSFITFLLRKVGTKKKTYAGVALLILFFICILWFTGGNFLGGSTFFAPTATPTRTPRPTPTRTILFTKECDVPIIDPFCSFFVEVTLDTCEIDNGFVIISGKVTNLRSTERKNIALIGLVCGTDEYCKPIGTSRFDGLITPSPIFKPDAIAESDWYYISHLGANTIQSYSVRVALPPSITSTDKTNCQVTYQSP